jgi:gliding motility-associated-like protein
VYKGPELYLPNAFTPNADGHNDVLKLVAPGIKTLNEFKIFNRSGVLLFQTKDPLHGWDGTYSGRPQPAGAYIWMLSAIDFNGRNLFKKGVVLLIR